MNTEKVTIKLTTTPCRKEKIKIFVSERGYKSVSSFVDVATDFYIRKDLHAGEIATSFFETNQCICQLDETNLNSRQKELVNNIKERMDTIYGYFQN